MRRLMIPTALAVSIALAGCADSRVIDGKKYEPYGLANADARRDPAIRYEISFGSAAAGVIFAETMLVPLYVVGWDLYQPVAKNPAPPRIDDHHI